MLGWLVSQIIHTPGPSAVKPQQSSLDQTNQRAGSHRKRQLESLQAVRIPLFLTLVRPRDEPWAPLWPQIETPLYRHLNTETQPRPAAGEKQGFLVITWPSWRPATCIGTIVQGASWWKEDKVEVPQCPIPESGRGDNRPGANCQQSTQHNLLPRSFCNVDCPPPVLPASISPVPCSIPRCGGRDPVPL